jgi:DNA-binding XRE family transcriptional regulator
MKLTLRHSCAHLRLALGRMTQKELAALAGCAESTIQSIEVGKLKLSPALAFKISRATGVNYSWLLADDVTRPIINHLGAPYSAADYELATDADLSRLSTYHAQRGRLELAQAYYFLRSVLDEVQKDDVSRRGFFLSRLEHFVRYELGQCRALAERLIPLPAVGLVRQRFLTPRDTAACDLMEGDAAENRRTILRYQKEIRALQKQEAPKGKPHRSQRPSQPAQ